MEAKFITLKNSDLQLTVTNYGARLTGLIVRDKEGNPVDIIAGFDTVEDYLNAKAPYYGATIGRFANRIAKGQFSLNDTHYQLPVNNGPNSLHGGSGFHDKVWEIKESGDQHIVMTYLSPDMEDGYPGQLLVTVTFRLDGPTLKINYEANADKDTIINLTNHAYFNLNGEGSGDILGHTMHINADSFTPISPDLIPTGEILSVDASPFDFRRPKTIGQDLSANDPQLHYARGYDHNYVLNKAAGETLSLAAKATGNKTGIFVETFTTEPGMQLYTGNFMDGRNIFKSGAADDLRTCFCLETQHFPDSPNQPAFPGVVLRAGGLFSSATHYHFGVQ